jgi:hypothetical protein
VKIELDADESWALMSHVVARLLDETSLPDADRAKIRRWRSQEMQPSKEGVRLLTEKINRDLAQAIERKQRSQIRKPDWR